MGSRYLSRISGMKGLIAGGVAGILLILFALGGYHAAGSPAFCISCHSMEDVSLQWRHSEHKQFACIECHLPDSNIAVQVAYKTRAGLNDLYHETLRTYPASIRASSEAWEIAEGNCMRCHSSTIENTFMAGREGKCLSCHHGLVHGNGKGTGGIRVE